MRHSSTFHWRRTHDRRRRGTDTTHTVQTASPSHPIISHTPVQKHSKWLQVFAPNHFTHPSSETHQMVTGVCTKSFHTPQFRNTANGYRCLHQIISHTPVQKHSERLQVFAPNHFTHPSSETQQMVTSVRTQSFHTPQFRNTANGYRCLHQIISHSPVQKHSKWLQVFAPNHFTHPSSETQQMVTSVRTQSFHTPQFRNTANGYRCFPPNHFTHPSSETQQPVTGVRLVSSRDGQRPFCVFKYWGG